jgi:hypothetical protein
LVRPARAGGGVSYSALRFQTDESSSPPRGGVSD